MGDVVNFRRPNLEAENAYLRVEIGRIAGLLRGQMMRVWAIWDLETNQSTRYVGCRGCFRKTETTEPDSDALHNFQHEFGCYLYRCAEWPLPMKGQAQEPEK